MTFGEREPRGRDRPARGRVARREPVARAVSRIRVWILAATLAVTIGTAGYMGLLGWGLSDALYMTVLSMTTVGYGEVQPLDDVGRAWSSLVILAGVALIGGTIGIAAEAALDLALRDRDPLQAMRSVSNHFILCGFGRVGATTAAELANADATTVVVELDPVAIQRATGQGFLVIEGDATEDEILRVAGIERCRGIVATMDADVKNVYLTLSARAIQPEVYIIARASSAAAESILRQAGANHVVSPYATAGRRIAQLAIGEEPA